MACCCRSLNQVAFPTVCKIYGSEKQGRKCQWSCLVVDSWHFPHPHFVGDLQKGECRLFYLRNWRLHQVPHDDFSLGRLLICCSHCLYWQQTNNKSGKSKNVFRQSLTLWQLSSGSLQAAEFWHGNSILPDLSLTKQQRCMERTDFPCETSGGRGNRWRNQVKGISRCSTVVNSNSNLVKRMYNLIAVNHTPSSIHIHTWERDA